MNDEKEFLTETKTTEVDFKGKKRVVRFRCPKCHTVDFFHITGDITVGAYYTQEEDDYFIILETPLLHGDVLCAECGSPVEDDKIVNKVLMDAQSAMEEAAQKVDHPDFDDEKFQKRMDDLMKESKGEETE